MAVDKDIEKDPENEVSIDTNDTKVDDKESKLEIVIEDDTPEADRGRKQIKNDVDPTEEEIETYSSDVQKRIRELTLAKHSARREKEATERERDEAVAFAKAILAEKQALQNRFSAGEEMFIKQAQEKTVLSVEQAKRKYKDAYEAGDAEAMANAQEELAAATLEKQQAARWQPTKIEPVEEKTLQNPQPQVYNQPQQPKPDPAAVKWAEKNPWFGENEEMTAMAYGVHDRLIKEGITPTESPEEYYSTIQKRVREKFPEYEWPETTREKNKSATVVAAVNRTPKSNRITLTNSQVSLAKRLGLTNEQYARELAKLETR